VVKVNKEVKELSRYIKKMRKKGFTKEEITEMLKKSNWPERFVVEAFEESEKKVEGGLLSKLFKVKFTKDKKEKPKEKVKEEVIEEKKEIVKSDSGGLSYQVKELNDKMNLLLPNKEELKKKGFKMKFNVKRKLKHLAKKNQVLVVYMRNNRTIEAQIADIKDGLINIGGVFHQCSLDFVFMWEGKYPCIVLPEWDMTPIGTEQYYQAVKQGRTTDAQSVLIRAIESKENLGKKKMDPKLTIGIIIGIAVLGYVLFGQGG
jgi:DNA-binding transcriptional MerR regulator